MADVSFNSYSDEFEVSGTVELTFSADDVMENIPTATIKLWIEDGDVTDYFSADAVAACFDIDDIIKAYKDRGEEIPNEQPAGLEITAEAITAFQTLYKFFDDMPAELDLYGKRFIIAE